MKVYVCPVCDHAMTGKHYCRNCHQFVGNPYFIDKNYSLDRAGVEPDSYHGGVHAKRQEEPKKPLPENQAKKKTGRTFWMILAVYLGFQVLMALSASSEGILDGLRQQFPAIFPEQQKQEIIIQEEEDGNSDWTYEEPDYDQILKEGEESTGFEHFDINGSDFLKKLHMVIMDADFEAAEEAQYMENYVAVNSETEERYSYYQKIHTVYLTGDYVEYYRVTEDSVSGRLINVSIESSDYDRVRFFAEAAASILFPEDEEKPDRLSRLSEGIQKIFNGEAYHVEDIGNMTFSGYLYEREGKEEYFVSLAGLDSY